MIAICYTIALVIVLYLGNKVLSMAKGEVLLIKEIKIVYIKQYMD
jgi:hypothetical protein